MKKILNTLAVLTLTTGMICCPSEAKAAKKDIVIGFVPMTMNNEYFITMVNGAKQKAKEMGVQLDVQAADQHASAAAQLTIVENMITAGVDGICIVPSSSEGLVSALERCKSANVPVINLDTKINESVLKEVGLDVPFFGTDNYAGAAAAGNYAVANFPKGTKTAILTGIEGQQNAADRRNGFYDTVKSKLNIVAEQSANWEVDQGYTATQNILSANPDLQLIFASNDGMAIGALRAVEEAELQDQVQIIGFDAISEALELVDRNEMLGTVAQYPAEMGILGVENVVNAINGKPVELSIDTGAKLITKKNVQQHKDYSKQFAD
ncbi:MAG: sugar ABC transporter substrate-binding protein [Spartobacteria bacterium]|nr:sugar ABC transporter substrate-binding protein [Spartobacteria bacterium]